jgi:hypothetical protein
MSSLFRAVVAFAVCFAVGTLFQILLRLPREHVRRNLVAGLLTSLIVALYVYFAG